MEFERMQVVWDEQKQRSMYALDLAALHEGVRRSGRRIARGVDALEIGMLLLSLGMAAFFAAEPLLEGTARHQYFSAGILLGVAVYLLAGRLRRRARERSFEPNLLGDIDRAIAQVDYHIRRIRTFPLWFMAPQLLVLVVSFVTAPAGKPAWAWLIVLVAFPLGTYVSRLELKCTHLPRKRELESLRAKLTEPH
jgi:membrane protein implicated in regulation of membrane protease activity